MAMKASKEKVFSLFQESPSRFPFEDRSTKLDSQIVQLKKNNEQKRLFNFQLELNHPLTEMRVP